MLAQDGEAADYMCRQLTEEYHHWGLKINVSKTNIWHQILMMTDIEGHKIKKLTISVI
jgi:hypothetical protein